jgi:sirohydrochlorin cobaltochelatase
MIPVAVGKALVLAAHGSRDEPEANARIRDLAEQVRQRNVFDEVAVAFHQGKPPFSEVLDRSTAKEVLVVPVMASQGYYAEVVLPRELARNQRSATTSVTYAPAIGTHPSMVELVATRLRETMLEHHLKPGSTTLALVGHGTRNHAASRDSTLAAREAIEQRSAVVDVLCAFLDDDPPVESLLERIRTPNVIVEPFLISDAQHAARDIPRRLGLVAHGGAAPPVVCRSDQRWVICGAALGSDERIVDVILAVCREATRAVRSTVPRK